MQATITYLLSEQAQRAQMAATGQPVARKQTTTEDIPADFLASPFCRIDADGNVTCDLTERVHLDEQGRVHGGWGWARTIPERAAQPASGLDALRQLADELEALKLKIASDWAIRQANIARFEKERDIENARLADEQRAKAEADAAKEREKTSAIDAFVFASGDSLLIAQHEAKLLCRKTVISRMAAAALDAAGLPKECPDSIVCNNSDCPCKDNSVECIPPEVYARWQPIADVLPDDYSVDFRSIRNCRGLTDWDDNTDRADPVEYHAVVTIPSGPFQFTRRIKLG